MLNTAKSPQGFFLSQKQRALLLAALVSLGGGVLPMRAQMDVSAIRSRADAGDADALNTLGNMYANGQGVPQNDV